jgi:hypothetical protein
MIKKLLILTVLLIASEFAFAGKPPTLPFSYNRTSPGARSIAMGGAGAAVPNTPEAVFYNPSALGYMHGKTAEISGSVLTQSDAPAQALSEARPQGHGLRAFIVTAESGGISWQNLSNTAATEYYGAGSYETSQISLNAVTLSVGEKMDNGVVTGLNIGYIYGNAAVNGTSGANPYADVYSANGFNIDFAMIVPLVESKVFAGLNLRNIAAFVWWDKYGLDQPPFSAVAGVSLINNGFTFALDYEKFFYRFGDAEESFVRAGLEQYLSNFFALRIGAESGMENVSSDIRYSYGFGLRFKGYDINAACRQYTVKADEDYTTTEFILSCGAKF